MLMLGAYDIGNAVQRQIALQEAVRSGGEYAVHFPTNPTAVKAAVMSALPAGWTLTNPGGVPVVTCSCTNANGTTTSFDCTTTPPCGAPMMVSITATMAYTTVTSLFASASRAIRPRMSPASTRRYRQCLGTVRDGSLEFALVSLPFLLILIAGMDLRSLLPHSALAADAYQRGNAVGPHLLLRRVWGLHADHPTCADRGNEGPIPDGGQHHLAERAPDPDRTKSRHRGEDHHGHSTISLYIHSARLDRTERPDHRNDVNAVP